MNDLTPRLTRLGDELERAARRELRPRPRRRRRRIALAAVAALVIVPGAAVAGYELISEDDVASSIPAGTLALAGTEPDCTVVRENVEFHCVLARPPAPEVSDWKGTVEPTVDATKHVNGGCRSLNSAGTEWQCYIGEEAVRQQIIGPDFLGEFAPAPGVG
jgi:hypothetical protein